MKPATWHPVPAPPGITVVYEDSALLVLDKPAGLLSVPGRGPENADCLSARVQALYADALVVHRLDMGTSGLLLMAKGPVNQTVLSRQFAQRAVSKRYEALVAGVPTLQNADSEGWSDIRLPLMVDWPNRPRSKVDVEHGKPSHTRWRIMGTQNLEMASGTLPCSRLELQPITGRSHQLRVHLLAIGHPIVGDELYASPLEVAASPRLLLHARQLSLPHPMDGRPMVFESATPF